MSRFPCLFLDPNGVNCKGAEDTYRTDLIRSLSSDAIEATGNNVDISVSKICSMLDSSLRLKWGFLTAFPLLEPSHIWLVVMFGHALAFRSQSLGLHFGCRAISCVWASFPFSVWAFTQFSFLWCIICRGTTDVRVWSTRKIGENIYAIRMSYLAPNCQSFVLGS